jgi:hypothetical protein
MCASSIWKSTAPPGISEIFQHARQMQDLIIASVFAEIANVKLNERFRDFQTGANEGGKDFVGQLGCIKVAEHDKVVVLNVFALEAALHPVAEALKLVTTCFLAVTPAGVHSYGKEVEIARTKRA